MCLPCAPMNCAKIGMRFLQVLHLKGSELLCIFDIKHVQMFDNWRARVLVDLVVCWYKKHYTANGWPFHLIAKFQAQRLASLGKDLGENSLHTLHSEILKLSTPSFPLLANGHLMGSYGGFGGKRILVNPFSSGFPRSCVLKTKSEQIPGTSQYR